MPDAPSITEIEEQLTAPGEMFETARVNIGDVEQRVWKNAPPTLRHVLELSLTHAKKEFLVYEDRRLTFEEHFGYVATLASRLTQRGLTKGERVVIAARNLPEWVVAFWATTCMGAVAVPLNAWWSIDELIYAMKDCGASVIILDQERLNRVAPRLHELSTLREIIVIETESSEVDVAQKLESPIPVTRFADLSAGASPAATLPPSLLDPEDDATMFYTSGTTGRPKGAVGTHRNVVSNLMNLFYLGRRSQLRNQSAPNDDLEPANLLNIPLFHATGCFAVMTVALAAGHKLVMTHHFDPQIALAIIEREKITSIGGVPTVALQIVSHPDFHRYDTSSVRSVSYGGAPAPPDLVRRIREVFPLAQPGNGYGLTETSAAVCLNSGRDYVERPESCGVPVPVCEVRVVPVDFQGVEPPVPALKPNSLGELWIKGPNIVRGYWGKPDETAQTFSRGWLHTGDVARIDSDGFVYIVDRAKDVIIRGGENVYSVIVEGALFEHPEVLDCAVVGVSHPTWGEEVVAAVVLHAASTLDEAALRDFVSSRLAKFECPSRISFFTTPLPRNPQGKVLKRDLRVILERSVTPK